MSRKGPGAGVTSQMAIAPAPVLKFKPSSGSRQNLQLRPSGPAATHITIETIAVVLTPLYSTNLHQKTKEVEEFTTQKRGGQTHHVAFE